jgi:DNA polymerase III delta prime subunit
LSDLPIIRLKTKEYPVVPSGLPHLDPYLHGGFRKDCLIHFYGAPGTGKTTFAMHLVATLLRQGWRGIWVDCNGAFSIQRFASLLADRPELLKDLIHVHPTAFQQQTQVLLQLRDPRLTDLVGIIVVDPITHFYRAERYQAASQGFFQELVGTQFSTLAGIAHFKKILVILINYGTYDPTQEYDPTQIRQPLAPLVRNGFARVEHYRFCFKKYRGPLWRSLPLEEHLQNIFTIERAVEHESAGHTFSFEIGPQGIQNLVHIHYEEAKEHWDT